jgi:hypothetical protein
MGKASALVARFKALRNTDHSVSREVEKGEAGYFHQSRQAGTDSGNRRDATVERARSTSEEGVWNAGHGKPSYEEHRAAADALVHKIEGQKHWVTRKATPDT